MKIEIVILLSCCLGFTVCIDTTCNPTSLCPNNSICSDSYCRCNIPYILDCQTEALFMTDSFQDITLTNETEYYQTQPTNPNVYYGFMFQVCTSLPTLSSYQLILNLWVDTGSPILNQDNHAGTAQFALSKLAQIGQCVDFVQYQIKLKTQPNGQTENLIIGLSIQPESQSAEIINATSIIQMRVIYKQIISSQLLLKLAIGIISAALFAALCTVAFCCYRRWKNRANEQEKLNYKQQLVEEFKKITPEVNAKDFHIPIMTSCSICLCDFEPEHKIRKIVCGHIFHSECIDSWCLKNLSCPVCRLDLDEESIKNKKKEIEMADYNWQQNTLSARQSFINK